MKEIAYERTDCRLCHSTDLRPALELAPIPLADQYVTESKLDEEQPLIPCTVVLCGECGGAQLTHVADPEIVYGDYIYETTNSLGNIAHFDGYAEKVLSLLKPPERSLVIDVGSNDGTLLRSYAKRGMRVLGIDPAREIAAKATAEGVETLPEFLDTALARRVGEDYAPAAVVTANNVIANIDDLDELIEAVRLMMAPDGLFVWETFYLGDLFEHLVFDYLYHEHISIFSLRPLQTFFRRFDMEIVDVERIPMKGGSLRISVQRPEGRLEPSPAVAELAEVEAGQGLQELEAWKRYGERIEKTKREVTPLLHRLHSEGKTLAGYGASSSTTPLTYNFEMVDVLDYLVDEWSAKQGRFSPGRHLPVLSPEEMYRRNPDHVVICAWRYWKPIVEKHPELAKEKGRFIVPMPELKLA